MLTWCGRAVNFSFPFFLAASRTRSSPLGLLSRLGVRPRLGCRVFSLVCGLPSTTSAGDFSLLFGCFVGIMPQYDCPSRSPSGPPCCVMGDDGASRFSRLRFLCMPGVFDSAGPLRTHVSARSRVAFWRYDTMGVPIRPISELNTQPTDVQRFE